VGTRQRDGNPRADHGLRDARRRHAIRLFVGDGRRRRSLALFHPAMEAGEGFPTAPRRWTPPSARRWEPPAGVTPEPSSA
jgi:hypothetical protein